MIQKISDCLYDGGRDAPDSLNPNERDEAAFTEWTAGFETAVRSVARALGKPFFDVEEFVKASMPWKEQR